MRNGRKRLLIPVFFFVLFILLACEGPKPNSGPTAGSVEDRCIVSRSLYSWSYEVYQSASGSGGVTCSAEFIAKNLGPDAVYMIFHTAWDNKEMQSENWKTFKIEPDGEWNLHVSLSEYENGDVTFQEVDRLLVIKDSPECLYLLGEENQSVWEVRSLYLEKFTCR